MINETQLVENWRKAQHLNVDIMADTLLYARGRTTNTIGSSSRPAGARGTTGATSSRTGTRNRSRGRRVAGGTATLPTQR
jgi:hypothetical protein